MHTIVTAYTTVTVKPLGIMNTLGQNHYYQSYEFQEQTSTPYHGKSSKLRYPIILTTLLIISVLIRLVGLQHSLGFHPDERHIMMTAEGLSLDDLNPHSFAYGSLIFYLIRAIGAFIGLFSESRINYDDYFVIGRVLSLLSICGTAIVVYKLALRVLADARIGLLGATLVLINPFLLQQSHFYTVDPILMFFTALCLLSMASVTKKVTLGSSLIAGITFGLALGVKISALSLMVLLVGGHLIAHDRFSINRAKSLITSLVTAALVAIAVMPYALIDYATFARHNLEQLNMVWGKAVLPYTVQYLETTPYLYHFDQMLNVTVGPWVLIPALLGMLWCLIAPKDGRSVLIVVWALVVFFVIGKYQVKFPRYLLPIYPVILLCAARAIVGAWDLLRSRELKVLGTSLIVAILGFSLIRFGAWVNLYRQEHSYVQASRWIFANIPSDSTLAGVHWDDRLPISLPGITMVNYPNIELQMYEYDAPHKISRIISDIARADYIIFPTQRIPGSIPRSEERQVTAKLLSLIFNDGGGFKLIKSFKPRPSFLGISYNDDTADESLSVYDHPKVTIFKNEGKLSAEQLRTAINGLPSLSTREVLEQILTRNAPPQTSETTSPICFIVLWIIAIELLALSLIPFLYRGLSSFPDLGLGVYKCLGLVIFSLACWLGNAANFWHASDRNIILLAFIWLALSTYLAFKDRINLGLELAYRKKEILTANLIFWGVFGLYLVFRAFQPEIFWGEKPMDSSFLHYFRRLETLPPEDPWAPGNPLNYYYLGTYIFSILLKLTNVPAQYGFNLAIATIAGWIACISYSLLFAISKRRIASACLGLMIVLVANPEMLRLALFGDRPVGFDLFWASTRLFRSPAFSEFPLWSLLFADLHAHLIAVPCSLSLLALSLKFFSTDEDEFADRVPVMIVIGLLLGALLAINTWDFLFYAPFVVICILIGGWRRFSSGTSILQIVREPIIIGAIALITMFPFIPSLLRDANINKGAVYPNEFNNVTHHLLFFGTWLVPTLLMFLGFASKLKASGRDILSIIIATAICGILVVVNRWWGSPSTPWDIVLFYMIVLSSAGLLISDKRFIFIAVLTGFGAIFALGGELFFLESRMNTIFKFYIPTGILFAISGAASLLMSISREEICSTRGLALRSLNLLLASIPLLVGIMGGGIAIYAMTTFERIQSPRPTLDGFAYLEQGSPDEAAAYAFLRRNIVGTPRILEAGGPPYREFGRVTMFTGLPTLLGWEYHVMQRGTPVKTVTERRDVIKEIYSSEHLDPALTLIRENKIEYILIGSLERKTYNDKGLKKFADSPNMFPVIFSSGDTIVYRTPVNSFEIN